MRSLLSGVRAVRSQRHCSPNGPCCHQHRSGRRKSFRQIRRFTRARRIAALSIPRVRLSAVVLHGSDAQTLRRGPGHLENTAFPGESGNVVIAGHRDSFFGPLRNITRGDDIFLDTPKGQFHYPGDLAACGRPARRQRARPDRRGHPDAHYLLSLLGVRPRSRSLCGACRCRRGGRGCADRTHRTPVDDAVGAAVIDASGLRRSVDPEVGVVDDESLVRLAVERYRLIYNGRLVSRKDVRSAGPVRFETCAVAVADNRATAACETSARSWSEPEPRIRTFILERAAGGWAIKSIVLDAISDLPSSR